MLLLIPENYIHSQEIRKLLQLVMPSVVKIETDEGQGSGVIINSQGYIITNFHVIADSYEYPERITIKTNSKDEFTVKRIVDIDEDLDLAIIKTKTLEKEMPITIIDPDSIFIGDDVVCIGNPFGLEGYVTKGIISKYTTPFVFTSANINPGNSGGALVNINGELVGIPTFTLTNTQNLNVAVCAKSIRFLLDYNKILYNE
jgi:S1-C subfamily serine protease